MVIYTGNSSAVLKQQRLPSSPVPPVQGLRCQWFCFTQCWTGLPLLHGGFASTCRAIQHCSPCTLLSSTSSLQPAVLELDFYNKLTAAEGDNSETSTLTLHSSSPSLSLTPTSVPATRALKPRTTIAAWIKNHGMNLHKREAQKNSTPRT